MPINLARLLKDDDIRDGLFSFTIDDAILKSCTD
jgi:hypothetical protein